MLIQHRNSTEKTFWRTYQHFINFESQIQIELSTLNSRHYFNVILTFVMIDISTNFRRGFSMSI